MKKFLIAALMFLGLATGAAAKGTPVFQMDTTGDTRCVTVWDLTSPNADKGVSIGCVNTKIGSWDLPIGTRNLSVITDRELKAFGYIGDGTSHPLNSGLTINGRPTSGWTLSQWQAVLPAAQNLTDEIDGVVLQSLINASPSGPLQIKIGPSKPKLTRAISTPCGKSVRIEGAGPQLTEFQLTGATNGWDHCATGTPTNDKIEFLDAGITTSDTSSLTNIGINVTVTQGQTGNGMYDNFNVKGFANGMVLTNSAGTTIRKGFLISDVSRRGNGSYNGYGIWFKGTNTFINHVQDTLTTWYRTGYRFQSTGTSGQLGLEDMVLQNSAAGEVGTCVKIDADYGGYSPLAYTIFGFSCNSYEGFVNAQAASQLDIRGGNWLLEQAVGSWNSTTSDMFRICRVNSGRIDGAWISNNTFANTVNSYVHFIANGSTCGIPSGVGASDFKLINNKIEYQNLTTTTAMIVKDSLAGGIVSQGNVFTSAFVPQASPPANAYSWSSFDLASALYLGIPGEMVTSAPGGAGITSATATNLTTLSVPKGLWSCSAGVFVNPTGATITAINAGFNTASAVLPTPPGTGTIWSSGSWTSGQATVVGPWTFDLTAATGNTNIYVVGYMVFSGGTATAQVNAQCVRIR